MEKKKRKNFPSIQNEGFLMKYINKINKTFVENVILLPFLLFEKENVAELKMIEAAKFPSNEEGIRTKRNSMDFAFRKFAVESSPFLFFLGGFPSRNRRN